MGGSLRGVGMRSPGAVSMLGLAVMLVAAPALARDRAGTVAEPAPGQPAIEDPADQQGGLEEIIITAQHRSENLQDVPIAVTAISAGALLQSGITDSSALPQIIPSVQFSRSGPSGLFFLRGVGQTNAATGEEGTNAIYVDSVYMSDLGQSVNYFNNIDRIEVLKGPQGTLFGRNATGGLIHVLTRDPGDSWKVMGQAGYANYDTVSGQVYVGGPLSNTVGVDLALTGSHQGDGWGRNLERDVDNAQAKYWGARSKLVFKPNDGIKLTLAGDYFNDDDTSVLTYDLDPKQVGTGGTTYVPGRDNRSDITPGTKRKIWGTSLNGQFDLGFVNLTSITAYRRNRTKSLIDQDGARLPILIIDLASGSKAFTQEVRLASTNTEPFSWQIGGFYLRSKATNDQVQSGSLFGTALRGALIDAAQITNSYAGFGEATYAITPTTHLTGGIRYTKDKRRFEGGRSLVFANGTVGPLVTQPNPNLGYSEVTYRASLRQVLTDDINVYGSVNRGFKAGFFSLQAPTDPAVQPQFIMAYEVGLKSQWFDRRLRVNVAAYHYDIDDLQIRTGRAVGGALAGASLLFNAAKVKVDGLEAEFEAAPTDRLRLFGGFNLLKSVFDRFGGPGATTQAPFFYPQYAPVPTTCPATGTANPGLLGSGRLSGGLVNCFGDAAGNRTPLAPKLAASFGGTYTIPVKDGSEMRLSALYSYNSGYEFDPDNFSGQGAFSLVNASIEYQINEAFTVEAWAKNLTNKTYDAQDLTSGTGTTTILAPPRTYGANVKFRF